MRKKLLTVALALVASFSFVSAQVRVEDAVYFFHYQSVYQTDIDQKIDFNKVLVYDVEGNKLTIQADDSKVDYTKPGHYQITLNAKDTNDKNYTKKATVIVSNEKQEVVNRPASTTYKAEASEAVESSSGVYAGTYFNTTVFSTDTSSSGVAGIANELVGAYGQCTEVAFMFYNRYYGRVMNTLQFDWIDEASAQPGDVIYYESMSGWSHVAVYLGDGMALHGNIQGSAQILPAHVSFGSTPHFARPILD